MASAIERPINQATHLIGSDDLKSWLNEHGVDARDVVSASVRIDRGCKPGSYVSDDALVVSAFLDLVLYMRDVDGALIVAGDDVAQRAVSVPLRSWPTLRDPELFDPRRETLMQYHDRRKDT